MKEESENHRFKRHMVRQFSPVLLGETQVLTPNLSGLDVLWCRCPKIACKVASCRLWGAIVPRRRLREQCHTSGSSTLAGESANPVYTRRQCGRRRRRLRRWHYQLHESQFPEGFLVSSSYCRGERHARCVRATSRHTAVCRIQWAM